MTTHFYLPPGCIHGDRIALPEGEARHALRALRLSAGAELIAVDGQGGWYRIVLDHVGRSDAAGHVVERRREVGEPPYRLSMAVGMIKHRGRFETFLEKAVELGVSEIIPLLTERTEKERLRKKRSENILIAAMKQCGRSRLPVLADPTPLEEVLRRNVGQGLCCHEGSSASLLRVLRASALQEDVAILVGPEGGFTDEEVAAARSVGYAVVSLGNRRLRAETAAITAAACLSFVYDSR